jgi:hypothetical protein
MLIPAFKDFKVSYDEQTSDIVFSSHIIDTEIPVFINVSFYRTEYSHAKGPFEQNITLYIGADNKTIAIDFTELHSESVENYAVVDAHAYLNSLCIKLQQTFTKTIYKSNPKLDSSLNYFMNESWRLDNTNCGEDCDMLVFLHIGDCLCTISQSAKDTYENTYYTMIKIENDMRIGVGYKHNSINAAKTALFESFNYYQNQFAIL